MAATWKKKYLKAFGENLQALRNSKKLSQMELSKRSGLSLSHISRMERGVRGPSLLTVADLAFGLKLEPKVLMEFTFQIEKK